MIKEEITRKRLDMSELRTQLAAGEGRDYWRSLNELAQTDEFQEMLHREFPEQASELTDPVSRRNFLRVMGASLAFGGLTGCTIQPDERIVPYVRAPEYLIPGKPLFYATAMSQDGAAAGLLVESHMGRPTKIEGNPEHPGSLGATHAIAQASILNLYDPDRSQVVKNAGHISTWPTFLQNFTQVIEGQRLKKGAGLRVLTQSVISPTMAYQLDILRYEFPESRWHQYEAAGRSNAHNGAMLAYGESVNTYCDVSKADVILSLDADFLYEGAGNVRYARQFATGRRVRDGRREMNRLYMVESTPTVTGSVADHRLALSTGAIESLALAVAKGLGVQWDASDSPQPYAEKADWIAALVRDLQKNRGKSLVVAGQHQSPAVHALAHAINQRLDNVGKTVHYTDPIEADPTDQTQSLRQLIDAMKADQVDALLILSGNPVFDAPADLDLVGALQNVEFRAHLGFYENETSDQCHWHIPESHFLESWSDARAYDGTVSIVQPLIQPLYNTHSAHELLGAMTGKTGLPSYDIIREYWQEEGIYSNFENYWATILHDGLIPDTALPAKNPTLSTPLRLPAGSGKSLEEEQLEIHFRPDPLIGDGRFANNGWLQEMPQPISKLTWDNAALISPATAERLGLHNEQVVQLNYDSRSVNAPVWIVPGQANDVVTVHLGYGSSRSGRVGKDVGFNAYALRTSTNMGHGVGLQVIKTFERYPLASTQEHHSMEGRHLVRHADLDEFKKHPDFAHREVHEFPDDFTLYSGFEYNGYAWGMAIDLTACIGCNACSVACQSENNIPVVGKEQVLVGREMSWIRIDRYYSGDLDHPRIMHQPVPCMQCENAPCELVCPVTATSHTEEGLNDMVYNRCVGTRYCANNCPYKVRRFNFLQYADRDTESLKLGRNPDVTVRSRGVMEKCTYCVQRINAARIDAKKSGAPIADGQITTACQQACPTEAIVFGDINDEKSQVAKLKTSPLNYSILSELNTQPRTTYLASVKNPNPEIIES